MRCGSVLHQVTLSTLPGKQSICFSDLQIEFFLFFFLSWLRHRLMRWAHWCCDKDMEQRWPWSTLIHVGKCVAFYRTTLMIDWSRAVSAYHLFGPVLRCRREIVEGVVSLSDPTEQHSHHTWTQTHTSHITIMLISLITWWMILFLL